MIGKRRKRVRKGSNIEENENRSDSKKNNCHFFEF